MRSARAGAIVSTALMALVAVPLVGAAPITHRSQPHTFTKSELAAIYALSPLEAPPPDPGDRIAQDPRAARLGQYLFFDRQFSANDALSCATCHQPARAFTDGRTLAKGLGIGTRNVPTLLNVAYNHWFFWDGRADSLWSQPLQVFENPREMGSDRLHVAHAVYADRALRRAYERLFGPMPPLHDSVRFPSHARPEHDPQAPPARAWRSMTPADRIAANRVAANVGKAIEAYERELVSRNSAFDRYVAGLKNHDSGKLAALSPAARRGLRLFVGAAHCDLCHAGPDFSDGEFHDIGLPLLPGEAPDSGRAAGIRELKANPFNGAGVYSDDPNGQASQRLAFLPPPDSQLGKFKTPTLRNVALTGPYMHDGRMATLRQVLQFYANGKAANRGHVVGEREATLDVIPHLTQAQISDLVAFLESLTGAPLPAALTRQPPSP
jgi:cytochrome c peroxidase